MKRKMKQKKGISPLIAAVLLIAFTVAIATLIAGWFSTLARTTTATVTNRTDLAVGCSGASISIDQVYTVANTSGGATSTARAIVRNNGLVNLSLVAAQLFNTTGIGFTTSTSMPVVLARGGVTTISFASVNLVSCPGGFSRVTVTTNCGGVSATFDSTPRCAANVS